MHGILSCRLGGRENLVMLLLVLRCYILHLFLWSDRRFTLLRCRHHYNVQFNDIPLPQKPVTARRPNDMRKRCAAVIQGRRGCRGINEGYDNKPLSHPPGEEKFYTCRDSRTGSRRQSGIDSAAVARTIGTGEGGPITAGRG